MDRDFFYYFNSIGLLFFFISSFILSSICFLWAGSGVLIDRPRDCGALIPDPPLIDVCIKDAGSFRKRASCFS